MQGRETAVLRMSSGGDVRIRGAFALIAASAMVLAHVGAWQQNPLPEKTGPLRKAMLLLREGKSAEARKDLEEQRKQRPNDPELLYQIARSYLLDFYRQ